MRSEGLEELGAEQMHLPKVRLGGISGHPGPMLDRLAMVGVANYSSIPFEFDERLGALGEGMGRLPVDRKDLGGHGATCAVSSRRLDQGRAMPPTADVRLAVAAQAYRMAIQWSPVWLVRAESR